MYTVYWHCLCTFFKDNWISLIEHGYGKSANFFSFNSLFYNINTSSVEDLTGRGWNRFCLTVSTQGLLSSKL